MSINCWEHKNCGREPGGAHISDLGVCPTATDMASNGYLGGKNAGRGCAYVVGTFCGGRVQGTAEQKREHCDQCDFYQILRKVHGAEMSVLRYTQFRRAGEERIQAPMRA